MWWRQLDGELMILVEPDRRRRIITPDRKGCMRERYRYGSGDLETVLGLPRYVNLKRLSQGEEVGMECARQQDA